MLQENFDQEPKSERWANCPGGPGPALVARQSSGQSPWGAEAR